MNIQAFSMPGAAYFNPTAYGDLSGLNYAVWLFSHLFFDMKFMSIFSMLFGAGVVLMADRMEARGKKPAGVHYPAPPPRPGPTPDRARHGDRRWESRKGRPGTLP